MLPAKSYEALEAVLYIALFGKGRAIRSIEICKYKGVSPRYLEATMQLLAHHDILKGSRGPKGGYTLAREKRKITVADIVDISRQALDGFASDTPIASGAIADIKQQVNDTILQDLSQITIEDLCEKLESSMSGHREGDFMI